MSEERVWICRFHPFNWWHEVGCPHMTWTPEQLADAERVREEGKKLSGQAISKELLKVAEIQAGNPMTPSPLAAFLAKCASDGVGDDCAVMADPLSVSSLTVGELRKLAEAVKDGE